MTTGPSARQVLATAAVVVCLVATAACGRGGDDAAAAEVEDLGAEAVPAELAGLQVAPEDVSQVQESKNAFVNGVGLYSLRAGELLQATLQISRFTDEAETHKVRFRQAVVGQIGSTTPQPFRMGDQDLYLTTGRRQNVAVWFKGKFLFVLATREEFDRPRGLLREALEIDPA